MADIKNITIDGTTYDLKDAKARTDVSDLKEDFIAKTSVKFPMIPTMENGHVGTGNGALIYDESSYYVRTSEGHEINLPQGTVISLVDPTNYIFDYCYKYTDSWKSYTGYTTLTTTRNGVFAFCVRKRNWATSGIDTKQLIITYPDDKSLSLSTINKKVVALEDVLLYNQTFWSAYEGRTSDDSYHKTSDYISINSGDVMSYRLKVGNNVRYLFCVYDSDYAFVEGVSPSATDGIKEGTYTFANDGFVRVENYNGYSDGYVMFQYHMPDRVRVELDIVNKTLTDYVTGTDYMQSAVDRITAQLKAKSEKGNLVVFGFNTDQHIKDEDDTRRTLPVLRGLQALSKLTHEYPYDFVCLGGDACDAGAYATTLNLILDECITVQKPLYDAWCPVVPITGNHDAAQNNANMTGTMLFNAHFKRVANSKFLEGWDATHTNGYWDSAAHNIRFIFFDDTLRSDYDYTARSNALSAMLADVPSGYNIVIFSHHVISSALDDSHWANPLGLQSLINPYADKIICCICGHSHADISETKDGILYIATTLAQYGYDADGNNKTLNTENETAYDNFVIDQANKKIYAFRYGYGSDRDWTYTLT